MPNSSLDSLVARARSGIREVERFAYRAVSEADNEKSLVDAQTLMRLVIGLRRKLDSWNEE